MKVVVIGTGFGDQLAAPAFREAGCEVQVVSPRDPAAVKAAVEAPCDLVSIHSPPFMHLDHVTLATSNGRHVLCDKPFGRNADEARQMVEAAARAGVLSFLNFEFRSDPVRLKLKSMLDEGAIGEPVHVSWTMHTSRGRDRAHGWLFDRGLGGGWIGAFGSHVIDALRWLFGDIAEVDCRTRTEVKQRRDRSDPKVLHPCTAEDAFTAWFRAERGVTVSIDTAFAASLNVPEQITVFGPEGALQTRMGTDVVLLGPKGEAERHTFRQGETDPHLPAMRFWAAKVCEAVAQGCQLTPSFAEGLAAAAVMDRMRAAAGR
jgi:predicted dehydrogenase